MKHLLIALSMAVAAVSLSLAPGDADEFRVFLAAQSDLGPKQWPSFVRVAASLPRTETFKVLKRVLAAEALECGDPIFEIAR